MSVAGGLKDSPVALACLIPITLTPARFYPGLAEVLATGSATVTHVAVGKRIVVGVAGIELRGRHKSQRRRATECYSDHKDHDADTMMIDAAANHALYLHCKLPGATLRAIPEIGVPDFDVPRRSLFSDQAPNMNASAHNAKIAMPRI